MAKIVCLLLALVIHVSPQHSATPNLASLGVTDGVTVILDDRNLATILYHLNQALEPLGLASQVGKLYAALYKEIGNRVEVEAFYHYRSPSAVKQNPKFVSSCNCKFSYVKHSHEHIIINKPNCWIMQPTGESIKIAD